MNKTGEIRYIVFVSVFLAVMTIGSAIFLTPIIQKEINETNDSWTWIFLGLDDLPIVGPFIDFIVNSMTFMYVHEYIGILLTGVIAIPMGYLFLRLIRGGG